MTERVVASCGHSDDAEESRFVASLIHTDNYNNAGELASQLAREGRGTEATAAALLALAAQIARIADVIEFAAETEMI